MNPAAVERARYYAFQFGSAAAALKVVDTPPHNDAFDREVCRELRSIQCEEARAAIVQKAAMFMQAAA